MKVKSLAVLASLASLILFAAQGSNAWSAEPFKVTRVLAEKSDTSRSNQARKNAAPIANSEAVVLQLVEKHLPRLSVMLDRLREANPRQYTRAIRDLSRWARRLEAAKERDPALHAIEVDLMKAETNVDFLSAKLKVRDDPSDRKMLRDAVDRLHEAKSARANYDVRAATERLEKAKSQLASATQRLESIESSTDLERQQTYVGLLKKAGRKPENAQAP